MPSSLSPLCLEALINLGDGLPTSGLHKDYVRRTIGANLNQRLRFIKYTHA